MPVIQFRIHFNNLIVKYNSIKDVLIFFNLYVIVFYLRACYK